VQHQVVLGLVRVLELVHQDVGITLLVAGAHVSVLAQEPFGADQQIVEIERASALLDLFVLLPHASDGLMPVGGSLIVRDQLAGVLGLGDGALDGAGRVLLGVKLEPLGQAGDELNLLVGVQNHIVGADARRLGLLAQQPRAKSVKGSHCEAARLAQELLEPHQHLTGGLVGKGDRQDAIGRDAPLADHVGDAIGQHASLARSWAGQDQHRAVDGEDGLALGRIESGEHVHRGRLPPARGWPRFRGG